MNSKGPGGWKSFPHGPPRSCKGLVSWTLATERVGRRELEAESAHRAVLGSEKPQNRHVMKK